MPNAEQKRRGIYCTFVTDASDKSLSREAKSSEIVTKRPACYLTKRLLEIWFLVPVLSCIIPVIIIVSLNSIYIDRFLILSSHLCQDIRSNFLQLKSICISHLLLRSFVTHIHVWVRASNSRANASGKKIT